MIDEIFNEIREMQINSLKKYTNELNILEGEEIINVIPKKNFDYRIIIHKFELVDGYINDDVLNEFHAHLCKEGIYLGIKSGKKLMIQSIRENPEIYDQLLKINPKDFVKLNFIPTFIGDMYDSLVNDEEENEENKDEDKFEKAIQSIKESMLNALFDELEIDKNKLELDKKEKIQLDPKSTEVPLFSTLYRDKKGEFTFEELTNMYYDEILREGLEMRIPYGKKLIAEDIQSNKITKEKILKMSDEDLLEYYEEGP